MLMLNYCDGLHNFLCSHALFSALCIFSETYLTHIKLETVSSHEHKAYYKDEDANKRSKEERFSHDFTFNSHFRVLTH